MKHLSKKQVADLIQAAEGDRDKLLLTMCYQHGLRVSECLSLTRAHVRRGFLMIRGKKKGKRTDERLSPEMLRLFESVTSTLLPHTLIFPFSRQWASAIFHRACERAGIALALRQGIHSLRHSIAHHLLDDGASLPIVQAVLRHRSISSTGVYLLCDSHDVDEWRARAVGTAGSQAAAQAIAHELPPSAQAQTQPTMTLAGIQEEIARLNRLALTLQGGAMKNAHGIGGIR